MTTEKALKICLITAPASKIKGRHILALKFLKILEPLADEIFVITGNFPEDEISNKKIHIIDINVESKKEPMLIKILRYILIQLKISFNLIKNSKNIDIVIFYMSKDFLLPMISTKLLKKRAILIETGWGRPQKSIEKVYSEMSFVYRIIFSHSFGFLSKVNYILSDVIVVYTENIIRHSDVEKHRNKILIAYEHFLDFNEFKLKKKFDERENFVGYIGRLSGEKGVLNFVKAIPKMLGEKRIKFLIGGDGQLRDKIEKYLDEKDLNDKVKLTGWIPDEEFSTYLNELKLFVLPSYTEGLPHTILEAMACGTPVLATPVGAIPDVIKDGETGFIMENNSPECIAENVIRALAHPNINEITKNARALVEENYNYQDAVDGYRIILSSTF